MSGQPSTVDEYAEGVIGGDRTLLARAITLVESQRADDQALARQLLTRLAPETGTSIRLGISGVPGVGKSTFIDALGILLVDKGLRVAVLAVDPSSAISGGSILGDKNRMPRLAVDPRAFVRPSPSALTLGGVGRRTRETMLVCEAAGYDVVVVETVGVGQSEHMVAEMVDLFLVLLLAGAGDELQGIKKGILELADLLAVNKADGGNRGRAEAAQREFEAALRVLPSRSGERRRPVLAVSGLTGDGLAELWQWVEQQHREMAGSGELQERRREQNRRWMWTLIDEKLKQHFRDDRAVRSRLTDIENAVLAGAMPATEAAEELLRLYHGIETAD